MLGSVTQIFQDNEVTPYAKTYFGTAIALNVIGGVIISILIIPASIVTDLIGLVAVLSLGFLNVFLLFLHIAKMCQDIVVDDREAIDSSIAD